MPQKYQSVTAYLKQLDARIRQGAIEAGRKTAREQVEALNEVTKTWENKVVFRLQEKQERGVTKFQIIAEGSEEALRIFGYVDKGTKPHVIRPKTAEGVLSFWTRFEPRTAPVAKADVGSGRSWGEIVWVRGVDHPGTEAREFTAYAMLEAEDAYEQRIEELLERVRRE
jgi:hypothetical protein